MFETPLNKYLVPYDQSFSVADAPTRVEHDFEKLKSQLETQVERIAEAQRMLYADNRFSVLLVFQAMDAAGKDSTIRAALSGVNPAGCHVSSFKKPARTNLNKTSFGERLKRCRSGGASVSTIALITRKY